MMMIKREARSRGVKTHPSSVKMCLFLTVQRKIIAQEMALNKMGEISRNVLFNVV
jgi:hypothetical protein